jgi:hypothetical protein
MARRDLLNNVPLLDLIGEFTSCPLADGARRFEGRFAR